MRLPIPPSMNHAYPSDRNGRRYKSKKVKEWEKAMDAWAMNFPFIVKEGREAFKADPGPLNIECDFYFLYGEIYTLKKTIKRNDTSNRLKLLHDKVAEILGINDCRFFDGGFIKRVAEKGSIKGYVNVVIADILHDKVAEKGSIKGYVNVIFEDI